jgi:hypothetical protein
MMAVNVIDGNTTKIWQFSRCPGGDSKTGYIKYEPLYRDIWQHFHTEDRYWGAWIERFAGACLELGMYIYFEAKILFV